IPAGYTVKAAGDIKVFGMVEAASVIAGGSIYIAEGFAGYKTGLIEADVDVQVGYINQGTVKAKNNIAVDNSIRHATCTAGHDITCRHENIIGGMIKAGTSNQAKDLHNRMNTATDIAITLDIELINARNDLQTHK